MERSVNVCAYFFVYFFHLEDVNKCFVSSPKSNCFMRTENMTKMAACMQRDIKRSSQYTFRWTAGNYSEFWGMTMAEGIQFKLGTMKPIPIVEAMNEIQMDAASLDIPEEFDARDKWPSIPDEIFNQGNCASSWAVSTACMSIVFIEILETEPLIWYKLTAYWFDCIIL